MLINNKRISIRLYEEFKKRFLDWALEKANDQQTGRFELAQEIWIEKELDIYKLKKEIERKNEQIKILEDTLDEYL